MNLSKVPKGTPIVVTTHLCFESITNKDELIDEFGGANVILVLGGQRDPPVCLVFPLLQTLTAAVRTISLSSYSLAQLIWTAFRLRAAIIMETVRDRSGRWKRYQFFDSYNPLMLHDLWHGIFFEFWDNWLCSYTRVVVVKSRKWCHSWGCFVSGPVRSWLAGGIGLKASNRTVVFTINRAKFDCGDIGAHHAFGWGIFLDGKVYNLI